jgi:glycosyltransferase involved in cell wall biosynthesis
MRVLFISTTVVPVGHPKYGGVEKLVWEFAEQMAEWGHKCAVAAPQGSKVPDGVELIETVRLPDQQDRDDLAYYNVCDRLGDFDVVHDFSHQHQASLVHGNLPVINMIWDPVTARYPRPKYNVFCLSRWQAERFANTYGQAVKYDAESLPVNTERYAFCPDKGDRFLFLGKLTPEKGALEAISMCRELGAPLDVCGGRLPTDPGDYELEVIRACDDDQIVYHGNVTDEVKIELLQHARALIYPLQEGFLEAHWHGGLEALSCGTPVVCYERGAHREVLEDGKVGFVVNSRREFVDAMKNIDKIRPEECRRFAVEHYGREHVVKKYLEELYVPVAGGMRW